MSFNTATTLLEKAMSPGNDGLWLAEQLRYRGIERQNADECIQEYATRKKLSPGPLLQLVEKTYSRPAPVGAIQAVVTSKSITMDTGLEIFNREFEAEEWYVEPFLHRGLTILGGPSKVGKSVLAHNLAHAVISGKPFSGYESEITGKVLWINLEERHFDVHSKLRCVWDEADSEKLADLHIFHEMPQKLLDGGEDWIRAMLTRDDYKFLVLDSLTAASCLDKGKDVFLRDYQRIQGIKTLCHDLNIAGLVVHHTNKRSAQEEDAINLLAGSGGLAAASDSVLVLNRKDETKTLKFRSRCTDQEDLSMRLDWDNGGWKVEGAAAEALSQERAQVLSALEEHGPCSPKQLAEYTGKSQSALTKLLGRLFKHSKVTKAGKGKSVKYTAVPKFGRKPGDPFYTVEVSACPS